MYINTFKYQPSDVSCQLCTEYVKKQGCTASRCPWLKERIEAGVVGYREAVFETMPGKIISEYRLATGENGHGALATLLASEKVDLLICGGIGAGAINALAAAGIKVVGGADGNVRNVAQAYLDGKLKVRLNFHCKHHHHGEGDTCGDHGCKH